VQDTLHGIGAVSIDGGAETNIDFYSINRAGDVLLWTSPVLTAGYHVFKLRVTGTNNPSSTNYYVVPDRVDIVTPASGPTAPTGLQAVAQSNAVVLTWNAVSNAEYYNVYRGTQSGGEQEQPIASPTSATYTDNDVSEGITYYYTVTAVTSSGTSDPSSEVSVAVGTSTLANGTYTITNSAGTFVWDDPAFSGSQGTNVILWPLNGGENQKWIFTQIGSGYYTIQNAYNGLVLDDPGFNPNSGTRLIHWSSTGGNNQHWLLTPSGKGYTITNESSGLVVDASSNTQDTDIIQATANGGSGQVWLIH
jgi:hypothetical protein